MPPPSPVRTFHAPRPCDTRSAYPCVSVLRPSSAALRLPQASPARHCATRLHPSPPPNGVRPRVRRNNVARPVRVCVAPQRLGQAPLFGDSEQERVPRRGNAPSYATQPKTREAVAGASLKFPRKGSCFVVLVSRLLAFARAPPPAIGLAFCCPPRTRYDSLGDAPQSTFWVSNPSPCAFQSRVQLMMLSVVPQNNNNVSARPAQKIPPQVGNLAPFPVVVCPARTHLPLQLWDNMRRHACAPHTRMRTCSQRATNARAPPKCPAAGASAFGPFCCPCLPPTQLSRSGQRAFGRGQQVRRRLLIKKRRVLHKSTQRFRGRRAVTCVWRNKKESGSLTLGVLVSVCTWGVIRSSSVLGDRSATRSTRLPRGSCTSEAADCLSSARHYTRSPTSKGTRKSSSLVRCRCRVAPASEPPPASVQPCPRTTTDKRYPPPGHCSWLCSLSHWDQWPSARARCQIRALTERHRIRRRRPHRVQHHPRRPRPHRAHIRRLR